DKETIRDWLRGRRQSKAPLPSIEQIRAELFSSPMESAAAVVFADTGWRIGLPDCADEHN
ncbi:MAG: hypothetical protein K2X55_30065, partial [Burkholderiaceae bacterium]|nr:hypothetical protein [Burkholderiaceae bacterium]